MNVGVPQRIIEVVPLKEPVPEPPEPEPKAPVPEPEPEEEPVGP